MQPDADLTFETWVQAFGAKAQLAGLDLGLYAQMMSGVKVQTLVLKKDRTQPEFSSRIWSYLDRALSDQRIDDGRKMLVLYQDLFAKLARDYGVGTGLIAAFWGIESAYGQVRGSLPVLDCLATLAFDGRRRAFFEAELLGALQILVAGDVSPQGLMGSWAGAMGHGQFMPSAYLAHAVDYDQDGKRDIWGDEPTDALASIAAYLQNSGWDAAVSWGCEVRLPNGFDWSLLHSDQRRPVAFWCAQRVGFVAQELPLSLNVRLHLPAGHQGPAFFLTQNFDVIKSYNASDAYALAVAHLADRLMGGGAFAQEWPRHARALTTPELACLQKNLTLRGYETKGADGKFGPNTAAAVRQYQADMGLTPDGFVTIALFESVIGG